MALTELELVEWLRRSILVHSYIYYELNSNVISDTMYDITSKRLVELQSNDKFKTGMYYYVFEDFDGTTGFDLFEKLNDEDKSLISSISESVLKNYKIDFKDGDGKR